MLTTTQHTHHIEANIILSNGIIAGTGFAPDADVAKYFACQDAIDNGYAQAACGHSVFLTEREELSVRKTATRVREDD